MLIYVCSNRLLILYYRRKFWEIVAPDIQSKHLAKIQPGFLKAMHVILPSLLVAGQQML